MNRWMGATAAGAGEVAPRLVLPQGDELLDASHKLIRAAAICEAREYGWRRGSESLGQLLRQCYAPDACFTSPWVRTRREDGWAALKVVFGRWPVQAWSTVDVRHEAALVAGAGMPAPGPEVEPATLLGVSIDVDVTQRRRWSRTFLGRMMSKVSRDGWDHTARVRLTLDADNLRIKSQERLAPKRRSSGGMFDMIRPVLRAPASMIVSLLAKVRFPQDRPSRVDLTGQPPSGTSVLATRCGLELDAYPQATDAEGRPMDVPAPRAGGRSQSTGSAVRGRYVYDPFAGTSGQWVMRWPKADVNGDWLVLDNLPPPRLLSSPGPIEDYPQMVDPGEAMVERTVEPQGRGRYKALSGGDLLPIVSDSPSNLTPKAKI